MLLLVGCVSPRTLKYPDGITVTHGKPRGLFKPFAAYSPKRNEIVIYNPAPQTPKKINRMAENALLRHELGHAWGIRSCPKKRCLIYENENRLIELLVKPLQALYGFDFCKDCEAFLASRNAFSDQPD
jgi:predicted Zn-dependent protease